MLLRGKPLESVNETDLQALVVNEIAEGKTIEYKSELPKNSNSDKKEFLADVSSFTNSSGGYLIYGIKEKGGVAKEITGIEITNSIESEILRLETIIRDGIDPRITGMKIQPIKLQNSKLVIIIEVPKSWAMPHMVIFQNHSRFFSRNSTGKNQLDVGEIRAAFVLSESFAEKVRIFRMERLSKIVSGETPVPLATAPKMILHIIPFPAFDLSANVDLSFFEDDRDVVIALADLDNRVGNRRYNFDGFLISSQYQDIPCGSYTQFFRNGNIEYLDLTFTLLDPNNSQKLIPRGYERILIKQLPIYMQILQKIGIVPPLLLMLSLIGVEGYKIDLGIRTSPHSIDRDALIIPEVLVEEFDCNPTNILKPIFDAVWNSVGMQYSLNYDTNGKWTGGK